MSLAGWIGLVSTASAGLVLWLLWKQLGDEILGSDE